MKLKKKLKNENKNTEWQAVRGNSGVQEYEARKKKIIIKEKTQNGQQFVETVACKSNE